MRPNLDSLTEEIQQYLDSEQFVVFRSYSRSGTDSPAVLWDSDRYPDFRMFLECAAKLGVRLVTFFQREFTSEHRENALSQLDDLDLSREEKRDLKRRIEELAVYEGFLCEIELAFDYEGHTYVFDLETEWYEEWNEIMDELEDSFGEEDEEDGPYGGYFSNN